ncbi:hypothetical protein BLS_000843 [Venturia inaequalis]|uniref:AB hydrolase-1 domain-containing protein n=1 Tax=Venturia inaequalis TaxID=5025 RepID=A0A8H3ZC69_VENIN|nr:hypothetical protein BLS_000843 [Venturia inaequalis]KAE9965733.1 hypothetical protein EG328_009433 [Venturia inaequalis]KAE9994180.1 hypothetical protein EG327_000887 [Venturia inaequalis]
MFVKSLLLGALSLGITTAASQTTVDSLTIGALDFNPYLYQPFKQYVKCPATDRSDPANPKPIPGGLKLAYLDINPLAKKTLVLVHGWPSLWTTYREQIKFFGKDYRLIIPENRGFGDSEHPVNLNGSNTFNDFVGDVTCMMDHSKVTKGVCVGNDFGAQVCWEAGRSRPDRFPAVFNVGTPYVAPVAPFLPSSALAIVNPHFSYQIYLGDHPDLAATEMNADIRKSIRSCAQTAKSGVPADFLVSTTSFLGPWNAYLAANNLTQIPASGIMSQVVEDYMVYSYSKQGFYNTYNGYQYLNRKTTFDFGVAQGNLTIPQPTFTLRPTADPVADWIALAVRVREADYLPMHQTAEIATSHWPHEEKPDEFNKILSDWLISVKTYF